MKKLVLILFLYVSHLSYGQHKITGWVVDGDNLPLIGASVFEEGTENITLTDLNGKFSIEVSDQEATLVFAYTGFPYKRIQVL